MLTDKIVIITGASSGIGAALAVQCAQQGAIPVLAARRRDRLAHVADTILQNTSRPAGAPSPVLVLPGDITNREYAEELVHTTVRTYGRIDVLINNAGGGHFGSVEDTSDDMIQKMFRLNVYPLWYTIRPALGYMKKQQGGHIVNVASMAGKIAFPFNSAYVAAKHAVVGFTHALRLELMDTGIHATAVCPAGVKTAWAEVAEGGDMLQFFSRSGVAIKRIAQEQNLSLPRVEGVRTADQIAGAIIDVLHNPVAELYTHKGSHELVQIGAERRESLEEIQRAVVLGEREVYDEMKKKT